LIGLALSVIGYTEMRGCYWDGVGAFVTAANQTSFLASSIIRPTLQALAGTTCDHETIIIYPTGGIYTLSGAMEYRNISIAQQTAASYLVSLGSPVIIPIEGVLKGDQTVTGLWQLFNVQVNALNPRADYDISDLFGTILTGGIGQKVYTWNPTCLERDYTGAETPEAIEDLNIEVNTWLFGIGGFQVSQLRAQTAASGRLEGIEIDRDGVNLIRQYKDPTFSFPFTHQVIMEKSGYRAQSIEYTGISQELNYDHFVDALQPDLEGEISL
jgi:hypothetical protein